MTEISISSLPLLRQSYDTLIFDLDGTLLDSMKVWTQVDRDFLGRRGIELTPDYTDFVKSSTLEVSAEYTVKRYNLPMTASEVISEWTREVDYKYSNEIGLKENADKFLKAALELGFKITCATSLSRKNAISCLKHNNVLDYFSEIHCIDEYPDIKDKTVPDIYLAALIGLGLDNPRKAIVFEDVPAAARGAARGGFATCLVSDPVGCPDMEIVKNEFNYYIINW